MHVSTPKSGATAVVQRGDTLYRIATRNGISVLDLAMWNNMPPPYTIYPGQRLRLYPSQRAGRPQSVAPVATPTRPRPATQPAPTAVATQPVRRAVGQPVRMVVACRRNDRLALRGR